MARSSPGYPHQSRVQLPGRDTRSSCKAPASCTSSAALTTLSPQQDTEEWEKRKEKGDAQRQVLLLGLEPPSLLQPQHREPQGGFHAAGNNETKGCSSGTSSPLWSLDRAEVISSNKLENVKKIQMM